MVNQLKAITSLTLLIIVSCNMTKDDHQKMAKSNLKKESKTCINHAGIDLPELCDEISVFHPYSGLENFRPLTPSLNPNIILKEGQLFRSDAFHNISNADAQKLNVLGIKTIIDLRSKEEIEELPNKQVPSVINIFNTPIGSDPAKLKSLGITHDVAKNIKTYFLDGAFNKVDSILTAHKIDLEKLREDRYREFATNFTPSVSQFFKILADSSNYPIVFHCQGGKDRTGFISAVLGKIIGYSNKDILRDYLTTNLYTLDKLEKQYAHGPKSLRPAYGAHQAQILASLNCIIKHYGNFEYYLKNELKLTQSEVNAIRSNLLNESSKVEQSTPKNSNASRFVKLEGVDNFRDIGGLKTKDGKTVKKGMLYRSAKLADLTNRDIETFKTLSITQIIDLRSTSELKKDPDLVPNQVKYLHRQIGKEDINIDDFNQKFLSGYWSGESFEKYMISGNIQMIEEGPYYFPQILKDIANNSSGASVYHCAGGKDRTGVLTALILELLNVPRESIINEYLTTNIQSKEKYLLKEEKLKRYTNNSLDPKIYDAKKAHRAYIEAALNTIDHKYHGIDRYLTDYLKVDPETIKKLKQKLTL